MNLTCDAIITESPNFMNMELSYVHTLYEIGSVFIPTTVIRRPTDVSNWLPLVHRIVGITADRVSGTRSEQNYNSKSDFETRRGGVVNKYFGRQNNSMSRPPLTSTPLGTNTNNRTTSPINSITVGTKFPEPTPLTLPKYFQEQNGKAHVPGDLDPDPSPSDSKSNKYNSSNDSNSSKSNKKKRDKKKKLR